MAIPFYVACDGGILQQEQKKTERTSKRKGMQRGRKIQKNPIYSVIICNSHHFWGKN